MVWPFKSKAARAHHHSDGGTLSPPVDRGGWLTIFEWFPGAFQQDIKINRELVLSYHAVFSCVTLVASDIAKMRMKLVREADGICTEIDAGKYPVLVKPNSFQNRIQFFETWLSSKLSRGNAYILKERNPDKTVKALYVLNPDLIIPLVSEDGEVFYRLQRDVLSGIEDEIISPASEVIHDRFNCLYHPLVGLSPIFACGLAATQGYNIQKNSAHFFKNMSQPGGILTTPGNITQPAAEEIKKAWETNYGKQNVGRVAVLGNDMKYTGISVNPVDAQMIEQLSMTANIVCSTYHVPAYKVVGDAPNYNNIEALEQQYFSQCLQVLMESAELCLTEGLDMPSTMAAEFDIDGLLRMDTATKIKTLAQSVSGGISTPNEARKKDNKPALPGGDTVYLQQQMYSIEALAKRDASDNPFASAAPKSPKPKSEEYDDAYEDQDNDDPEHGDDPEDEETWDDEEEAEALNAAASGFLRKALEIAR